VEVCRDDLNLEAGKIVVCDLGLSGGFKLPSADLIVLSPAEIYGWRKLRRPKAASQVSARLRAHLPARTA